MNAIVEARGASKWYGDVLGLNSFTASFGSGITGLVGPNGAGKSTLFKVLIGQLRLDQGDLRFLGQDPWNNVGLKRRIGYCPESNTLYGWLTGEQFVENLLQLDGMSARDASAAARKALQTVGLTAAKDRRLRTYSRGMRQRAKLAQALAHEPEALVLDEPLSGTDPAARVRILETIDDFAKSNRHVIMSTHVLYEVERLTHNIVLINNGKAIASGDIHAIRGLIDAHPHSVRIATPDARAVARAVTGLEHVVTIDISSPNELLVRTRKPDDFYRVLPELVVDQGLQVNELESPDDSLEAVFRYLVG
jgi:ABC-2 type transport system ATP-binding protein